ncbi:NAD(P)-dependent oxidoreductase [Streptomyces sp. NPDC005231]
MPDLSVPLQVPRQRTHTPLLHPATRRWDIGPIDEPDIVGMPLLQRHLDAHPGALRDVHILYVNHAISDALMVARAFHRLGATLTNVLVPYHGVGGTTEEAMYRSFSALGTTYLPSHPHPSQFGVVMRAQIRQAVGEAADKARRQNRRWMIVEDGGYAFPLLHDDPVLRPLLGSCLGSVEHTTRGRWNYEYLEVDEEPSTPRTLGRPAVTISGSALKTAHEAGFVAQALLDETHFLLRRDHQFLRHRKAVVIGYGRVGKALAHEMTTVNAEVTVVDPVAPDDLPAGLRAGTLVEAIADGAFLVFGATGTSSFTREALTAFLQRSRNSMLYLASASSKAVEFADLIGLLEQATGNTALAGELAGDQATVTVQSDPSLGIRYHIRWADGDAKQIVLLGDGYPVIFYPADTHGAPNRAMDPVMTQLFLAAVGLASASDPQLPPRVHDLDLLRTLPQAQLPAAWTSLLDEEDMLAQWCALNDIDWPTYRNAVGFTPRGTRANT